MSKRLQEQTVSSTGLTLAAIMNPRGAPFKQQQTTGQQQTADDERNDVFHSSLKHSRYKRTCETNQTRLLVILRKKTVASSVLLSSPKPSAVCLKLFCPPPCLPPPSLSSFLLFQPSGLVLCPPLPFSFFILLSPSFSFLQPSGQASLWGTCGLLRCLPHLEPSGLTTSNGVLISHLRLKTKQGSAPIPVVYQVCWASVSFKKPLTYCLFYC